MSKSISQGKKTKPPVLTADDVKDTLSAYTPLGSSEIVMSVNSGVYIPYAGQISVGNISVSAGYWKFKVKAAPGRLESSVVQSPAFNVATATTPASPILTADDIADILLAYSPLGDSEILVSENNASYVAYAGQISVGNVARATGYWKFKIKAATGRNESAVVDSPAFNIVNITPAAPILTPDDIQNTLSASSPLGISEILVSENNGSYIQYTGQISVGNVDRVFGYWKFKIKAATGRNESSISQSPVFWTTNITPAAPTLTADDTQNTLSASSPLGTSEILVSENNATYAQYTGQISVGSVDRAFGYWKFKIKSATGRNESAVTSSPAFTITNVTPAPPIITADDTANTLNATSPLGTSEILVSENNGSYTQYTTQISVGNVTRASGYWKFKIKAAAGRDESAVVESPEFTIGNVNTNYGIAVPFTINSTLATSAGIYNNSGVLLRTLWNNETYAAGSYTAYWDGKDDNGNYVVDGGYVAKIIAVNMTTEWGLIGNTSDSQATSSKHRSFQFIHSMCFTGNTCYYGVGYNEAWPANYKFLLSDKQSKIVVLYVQGTGAFNTHVCTDGTKVYWAAEGFYSSFVYATNVVDDTMHAFSSGTTWQDPSLNRSYSAISKLENEPPIAISGIAVQPTGNYLFVARKANNTLYVLNKSTGALVQTLSYGSVKEIAVQGDSFLWMIRGAIVEKYTINVNGTLTTTGITLAGLVDPRQLDVSFDQTIVAIVDAGSSQQVKAYATSSGSSAWTLGTAGGYSSNPTVNNNKFYFSDSTGATETSNNPMKPFIAFQQDGTFWVGDAGNYRAQHYAADRSFIDRIMYIQHFYSVRTDLNDPTRVFAEYLEFAVDYTKALLPDNDSWVLVRNWRGTVTPNYYEQGLADVLRNVVTLSNGRTYAFLLNIVTHRNEIVELGLTTGLRNTGLALGVFKAELIDKDGNFCEDFNTYNFNGSSGSATWTKKALTGFDGSNNPIWGAPVTMETISPVLGTDPFANDGTIRSQKTDSGAIISWDKSLKNLTYFTGLRWHLGGVKGNQFIWRTAENTHFNYRGEFPKDGRFDIGNTTNFPGGEVQVKENIIAWEYHGEFWKQSQTNIWNIFYHNGLMLGQIGLLADDYRGIEGQPMLAGNGFSGVLNKVGNDFYIYHNDEGVNCGIHRWRLSGLNSIQEFNINVTKNGIPIAPPNLYEDLCAGLPFDASLPNNTAAWTRNPATDITDWYVKTGLKSYKPTESDVSLKYQIANSSAYVQRDLGTVNSATWEIDGYVSWDENSPIWHPNFANPAGGVEVHIIDNTGKIILRVRFFFDFNTTIYTLYANDIAVHTELQTTFERTALRRYKNFHITKDTFTYYNYTPVVFAPWEVGANVNTPKTFKMYVFNNDAGANHQRAISINRLKLKRS